MKSHAKFLALAVLLVQVLACGTSATELIEIRVGGVPVLVEIAATPASRSKGLMNRRSMPENQGMLFIFPASEVQQFWMKNTLIPLTIAYIDEASTIRTIKDMQPLDQSPVSSEVPVIYALEVNQGFFARNGVSVGDKLDLPAGFSAQAF